MEKQVIFTDKAPAAIGPYSAAIHAGSFIFTSGQIPVDPATGSMPATIEEQTRQSLNNVKAILEAAGTDMAHVVKTTVFLQSMSDFAAMNGVYSEFFSGAYPARSAVEVACLPKGAKVEIEAIAVE
jgi:2-iminobutanoate/2-iminopropanoate deaminase